jgi:site-specific recombinase XerD
MLDARARRLSEDTQRNYALTYRRFAAWLDDDRRVAEISAEDVAEFLAGLADEQPAPAGVAPRTAKPLSKKTTLNYHGALGALWSWAVQERVAPSNVVHAVPRPRPEKRAVEPFSAQDVKALLAACERTAGYKRPGKRLCDNERPTALRDRAIILLLVDTGMRAGELAGIHIRDCDVKNGRVKVFGKGAKERILPFSAPTGKAIWRYLQAREGYRASDPLFLALDGAGLTREALLQLINSLGERAGVNGAHPHRFRHTFAVTFLRNGGNAYELQAMLGHTTLEMVRQYVSLAQTDVEAAHRRASPVENWGLK